MIEREWPRIEVGRGTKKNATHIGWRFSFKIVFEKYYGQMSVIVPKG